LVEVEENGVEGGVGHCEGILAFFAGEWEAATMGPKGVVSLHETGCTMAGEVLAGRV
jgi:hypothetical protein